MEYEKSMVESFQNMWGNYPGMVMLISKNRDIVAVNTLAENLGIRPGIKCFSLSGKSNVCDHCQANKALSQGVGIRNAGYSDVLKQVIDGFWVPLQGSSEFYVHFGNDISEYAKSEMFLKK